MSQRYPTDLTDAEWAIVAPFIPAAKPGGRPRTTDRREVVNATFYILRSGGQWRMLPQDFPPHQPVYHYFRVWRRAGVWERMHDTRRGDLRAASGRPREPSAGIIDRQTVKTTEKGGAGAMTAASAFGGASATLSSMSWGCSWSSWCIQRGSRTARGPNRCSEPSLHAARDCSSSGLTGGYAGKLVVWMATVLQRTLVIVKRPRHTRGFQVLQWRWIVERTFGWLNRSRRLSKDFEALPETTETWIRIAMIQLMVRRLAAST